MMLTDGSWTAAHPCIDLYPQISSLFLSGLHGRADLKLLREFSSPVYSLARCQRRLNPWSLALPALASRPDRQLLLHPAASSVSWARTERRRLMTPSACDRNELRKDALFGRKETT